MNEHAPLSILIPVRNERANIEACIASCRFADEIVVVDSGSTDGTPEIARGLGANVIEFSWNGRFPKKKNWALDTIPWRNEWVFILDADERITPELAEELGRMAAAPTADGYYVNRRFWFLNGWLRHCGYYPSWNLRFFRHRLGRYEQFPELADSQSGDNEVHEHVILQGRTAHLRGEMDHYAFPSIEVWLEKHNRYSNWEARLLNAPAESTTTVSHTLTPALAHKRWLKRLSRHLPCRPLARFVYHYIFRLGFLDGYRGYVFCRLMGFYEFVSEAKAQELRQRMPGSG